MLSVTPKKLMSNLKNVSIMNPLYNTNDSPNNSTQPTKSVNRQGVYVPRTHNTFDMSYFHYTTQKFGIYQPFFAMEAVAGDKIPLHSSHNVRSLPMSSPFLSELKLNKDYFMVPMQAILPNTWEYIFKNPTQGDDVPDDANCLFPAFSVDTDWNFIDYLFAQMCSVDVSVYDRFWWLLTSELFLSQGSLLAQLGYHINPLIYVDKHEKTMSFDEFFDTVCRSITNFRISIDGVSYTFDSQIVPSPSFSDKLNVTLSQILSLLRSYGSRASILSLTFDQSTDIFKTPDISLVDRSFPTFASIDSFGTDINISRVLAYQMSCCQFYVNPQVDFLYNAQLYRDNLWTLMKIANPNLNVQFFTMNGIQVPYDYASKCYMYAMLNNLALGDPEIIVSSYYDWFSALFGHRESLRFGDYFTDSRTRPLALGDDSIEVANDNSVSVIDVSKKIVYQRFRNAVVKLGNNFGDYLRGIFGTTPSPDYHFPKFISHQDFVIGGFEVANNTSDDQGKLVTNLNTRDDTFAFEVEVDMPCVLIGISYFSVPRVYMQTKDRQFFHRDRYDMFNPMLQYIGDQIVYNHERTDYRPNDEIFGYQSRNNEYKQRYSVVSGAFSTKLPAWTFVADSVTNPVDYVAVSATQSPEFIRAHDYEFNRFFAALSGYSLANSFHFIVVYNNKCMATRPMEVNPNIL